MKECTSCGAELSDEAKICRECGALQSVKEEFQSDSFAMPYLSSTATVSKKTEAKSDEKISQLAKEEDVHTEITAKNKTDMDAITDPRERAFAKQDRRNKLMRITAVTVGIIVALAFAVYFITRNTGYYRTLEKYIEGMACKDTTGYSSIVPDVYLIEAERLYDMSRPEIRSNTKNYLKYVKTQIQEDYGNDVEFSYEIIAESTADDTASLDALEKTIISTYNTDIDISEVAYVSFRLSTEGSVTQTKENKSFTFFKYDGDWYSLDAMQIIQFANENAGYGLW